MLVGEVLRVMDRGTQSINNLLSYILFNIVPTLVDIGVAVVYFIVAFDGWFGLIVFSTMISYIYFTIFITEWRTKFRRSEYISYLIWLYSLVTARVQEQRSKQGSSQGVKEGWTTPPPPLRQIIFDVVQRMN